MESSKDYCLAADINMQKKNKSTDYVIGIDIGATKSHLALFDTAGNLVDFGYWGALNHEVLPGSYEQFHKELAQFTMKVLSKKNIKLKQVVSTVLGVAGVDTKSQYDITSSIIEEIGFKNFTLANNSFLGIPAGSPTGIGICAINGTGCTIAGLNKNYRMLQIGGVGYISDDFGGGYFLGEKVVSTVYSELFRKGEPTYLTAILLEKLGITDKYDFVDKVYEKIEDESLIIPDCVKMLFEAVKKDDKVAANILRSVGESYANGISCMIDEMGFNHTNEETNIVFAGSVFVKGEHPLLLDTIKKKVSEDNPDCKLNFIKLKVPTVAGAVFWALSNSENKDNSNYYEKVCTQLFDI